MRRRPDTPICGLASCPLAAPIITLVVMANGLAGPPPAAGESSESVTANPDFSFTEPRFTLGLRAGYAFNRSRGDIYDFLVQTLTLSRSDFDGPAFALDGSIRITSWLDAVLGLEVSYASAESEYRDFVTQQDEAIEQRTSLVQLPLTFSLKAYPMRRGRKVGRFAWVRSRFAPYLGGGIGATWYKLEQEGDFVDFQTLDIFESKFSSDGWGFSSHAFVGLDIKLSRALVFEIEGRFHWTRADLSGSYVGFERIRLGGARVMAGLSWPIK